MEGVHYVGPTLPALLADLLAGWHAAATAVVVEAGVVVLAASEAAAVTAIKFF